MTPSFVKSLRLDRLLVPAAAIAIAAAGLAWWAAGGSGSATSHEPADGPTAKGTSSEGPVSVRLARDQLGQAAGIDIESVQTQSVERTIRCNGNVEFDLNKFVKVPPRADGIINQIHFDVGASAHAGDVLAVINSQPFGDLKGSLLKALVHEEHLRWQIERYEKAGDGIAAKNLFETRHLLEEQRTDTARIKERLREYGLSRALIEHVVTDKDISIQLPVIAPRDGVVVERQAVEGQVARADTPLFALADLDVMWVHLAMDESQLSLVHLGQAVRFLPDGLPGQVFEGSITWISPKIDLQTRSIQLRAEVSNHNGALRANMFGKGELLVEQPQTRLVVPQAAVQTFDGQHVVFVQKPDNLFEVRRIGVGLKTDRFWEVTSGLKVGEKVATTGSFLLKSNLENPDFGKVE
jgi:cobalt-zinc-cadmium efflux system membrane fusion protein